MSARRVGMGLALGWLALAACGEEIDSQPEARAQPARSRTAATPPAPTGGALREASQPAGGAASADPSSAAAPAPERYRTHLYSERDADVHALLDDNTSLGSSASVKAVRAELGDRVRAGQVLAVLDDARPTLAVQAAKARADELQAQLQRTSQLLEKGFTTVAEHDRLTHALAEATADLDQARLDLARTRVVAPFAGVVARRYVRVGEQIDESTPLFRITALSPLRARVMVPQSRAQAFGRGTAVTITTVDGTRAEGRVVLVGPTIDAASGTREVIVEVPGGDGLLPGGEVVAEPSRAGGAAVETGARTAPAKPGGG